MVRGAVHVAGEARPAGRMGGAGRRQGAGGSGGGRKRSRTAAAARAEAGAAPPPPRALESPVTVAITGATGFVGTKLTAALLRRGDKVVVLSRDKRKARTAFPDPRVSVCGPDEWERGVGASDAVVNLAGEPISTRWTPEIKAAIRSSRLGATRKVVDAINAAPAGAPAGEGGPRRPAVLVSGSALGYYGSSQTECFSEESAPGSDYLARVCQEWEDIANEADTRVVSLRTGIVLGSEGGALSRMLPIFRMYAGGPVGTGTQWFSWIHIDDHVNLIIECITNPKIEGPLNGTAPTPVTMAEMCSSLGRMVGRPSWLPVPEFALKALLGEGASVVLEGQRVLPDRALKEGFRFKYTDIGNALADICK